MIQSLSLLWSFLVWASTWKGVIQTIRFQQLFVKVRHCYGTIAKFVVSYRIFEHFALQMDPVTELIKLRSALSKKAPLWDQNYGIRFTFWPSLSLLWSSLVWASTWKRVIQTIRFQQLFVKVRHCYGTMAKFAVSFRIFEHFVLQMDPVTELIKLRSLSQRRRHFGAKTSGSA